MLEQPGANIAQKSAIERLNPILDIVPLQQGAPNLRRARSHSRAGHLKMSRQWFRNPLRDRGEDRCFGQ